MSRHAGTREVGGTTTDYLHHDHLGSVVAITSGTGTLTERLSYDPWGKRRNATTNAWSSLSPGSQLLPATLALLPRGYTSHEHLDKLGLIHMNGRVYDPELGRFLSADPLIQFPESTQGFDRYAYVGNSPLSYTDPSGHGLLGIVGSIVSFFYPPVGALLIAVDGYLEGGLQGALFSVASMAAAAGVGDMFGPVGNFGHELARAAVHGLIQGALGAAQGGKFGAAFMSAGVTSGYGSKFGQMGNRVQRVIGAAVLGGTVSKIGGGKFANGAVTGAFVQAFAKEGGAKSGRYGLADGDTAGPFSEAAPAGLVALREANPDLVRLERRIWDDSQGWFGEFGAEEHALVAYENLEDGSLRYERYAAGSDSSFVGLPKSLPVPDGYRVALIEHTHPFAWGFGNSALSSTVRGPSPSDLQVARDYPGAFHVIQAKTPANQREFLYYGKSAGF